MRTDRMARKIVMWNEQISIQISFENDRISRRISISRDRTSKESSIAAEMMDSRRKAHQHKRMSGGSFIANQKISWRTCIGREQRCTRKSI